MVMQPADLRARIRSIPDFPKPGIVFRDITPLLADPAALDAAVELMAEHYRARKPAKIVSVESRGFIFGSALACRLGAGFVPVRKPGKLPAEVIRAEYQLEYGSDALEMHRDAVRPGERVLLVDDLLATGGTILAAASLVTRLGGVIESMAFLIELSFLKGRDRIPYDVFSLIRYDAE